MTNTEKSRADTLTDEQIVSLAYEGGYNVGQPTIPMLRGFLRAFRTASPVEQPAAAPIEDDDDSLALALASVDPCPFCGSENVDPKGWLANDGRSGPACDDCGATAESVEGWNRRAPAPSPTDERAAISEHDAKGLEIIAGWLDKEGLVEPATMLRRLASARASSANETGADVSGAYTYSSVQATNCARCGNYKHTPLRIDWMGGYVCLTCIDRELESRSPAMAAEATACKGKNCGSLDSRFHSAECFEEYEKTVGLKPAQADARIGLTIPDTTRALLLNVLWHHQGGSSEVGQPIRKILGIGEHDHLTGDQLTEAKRIERLVANEPMEDVIQRENDRLRADLKRRTDIEQGHCWYWIGDGCDELESLTCQVIIKAADLRALLAAHPGQPEPIDMLLFCPKCGAQHVDAPEPFTPTGRCECAGPDECEVCESNRAAFEESWQNPPHRSHLCHACGTIWRPADVPTNGAAAIQTRGKADTWNGQPEPRAEVTHGDTTMGECMASLLDRLEAAELYADRYRYLRERPLDAVSAGGVFAGKTPDNVVLNGADLDAAIDAARTGASS